MSHISEDLEQQQLARIAALQQQDQRSRRPTQIQLGDAAVAVSHADFGDARIHVGKSIHVELIEAGQARPFADTTWEAQLDFSAGGAHWYPPLAQIEQAAVLLATARLRPSIPMSVDTLIRRGGTGSWRVMVRKPYDGWD
jgi:hypothetical protein